MIFIFIDESSLENWTQEELWVDWMTNFQCRAAYFEKNSLNTLNLISSPNINLLVFLIPVSSSLKVIANCIEAYKIRQVYLSDRSEAIFEKSYPSLSKSLEFKKLDSLLFMNKQMQSSTLGEN